MKLLRYGPVGQEKPGLMDADGVIRDLSAHITDVDGSILSDDELKKLSAIDPTSLPAVDGDVRIGACVGNVGKFICVGLNYSDHAAESGMEVPEEPVIFTKYTSAICGSDDNVLMPRGSTKMDWEVELGLVIGKHGKYIDEKDAMDHIAGYCVVNDLSERDFQMHRSGQWVKGKSCDTFGPIGPWMVTRDEVPDVLNLGMYLEVNGHRYQNGNTKTMIFNPAYIVAHLSEFMSLHPGDIISTGTPPGVGLGQTPETYLKVGDRMELGIEGLGVQRQLVVADD